MLDSLYLEQNVIGALLIQPECYEAAAELSPDDFLVPEYAELFRAIQRRNEAGAPADAPSVLMDASSRNDNVTSKIMTDCMEVVVTTANIDVWVSGMRDASMGRKLRDLGEELRTADLSPQDALRTAQEAVAAIQDGAGVSGGLEVSEAVKCLKIALTRGLLAVLHHTSRPACRNLTDCWAVGLSTAGFTSSPHGPERVNLPWLCKSPSMRQNAA